MKLAGIIAEYDPFHNGHAWQLAQAKALGAERVAVAMSCGLTQRGALPLLPEAVRVRAALTCGADLVFALPAPCACAGAETFARAGVRVLSTAGCDGLVFGAETPDAALLMEAARVLCSEAYRAALKAQLAAGARSFAAARQAAVEALCPGTELAALLDETRGQPIQTPVHTCILRSMQKARYAPQPLGHYGLVLADYAHFTSPIRRYPDLAIHRIMTAQLKGTDKDTMILRYTDFAERASKQASEREVIAMQIERKAEDCYKAEYARRHLGESYEGRISGVTQRGLFIELENGVEGFVPASSLTATGTMLTEGVRLSDPVSGKNWNLGDTMMITIVRSDVNLGKIDFEVAQPTAK